MSTLKEEITVNKVEFNEDDEIFLFLLDEKEEELR